MVDDCNSRGSRGFVAMLSGKKFSTPGLSLRKLHLNITRTAVNEKDREKERAENKLNHVKYYIFIGETHRKKKRIDK